MLNLNQCSRICHEGTYHFDLCDIGIQNNDIPDWQILLFKS